MFQNINIQLQIFCASTVGQAFLDIRLVGGSTQYKGVIEVLYDVDGDVWGTVCNATWSHSDAEVACRSLGYTNRGEIKGFTMATTALR